MRLMFLSPTGQLGGAETSLADILASIRHAEPSWPLRLVVASSGPLVARATDLGVTTTVLAFPRSVARLGESGASGPGGYGRLLAQIAAAAVPAASYVRRLRRVIAAFNPDLLHTNGLKMHLLTARASDRPLVWHIHDYLGTRPLTARLLRWNASRCSAVVANSRSVASDVRAAMGHATKVVAVHNGVDLERFSPDGARADLDALAGLAAPAPGTIRAGLLGTFARWKGHAPFLQAIAKLPADLPVRAYVIGEALYQTDGSQHTRADLEQLAVSIGLGGRVGFTGFVTQSDAALRALDIVVHASTLPEPFGLAIAEAMACGRAVVISAAGGATELVTPSVDALTHAPGDVAGLSAAIARLAADEDLRDRLGRTARATAVRAFDRARLAVELIPVYRSVTAA